MGFANVLALPERLSTPAALELLIFVVIFKKHLIFRSIFQAKII